MRKLSVSPTIRSVMAIIVKTVVTLQLTAVLVASISLKVSAKGKEKPGAANALPPPAIIQVKGTVKDDRGALLAGVSVSVVGKTGGVSTDEKGNFSILFLITQN